jgi:endonuclease/exonuclease/phosphatase family metal-dependent hydrolase
MSAHFSQSEWQKITQLFDKISNDPQLAESFGLPEQRDGSVVIGSFNIRKLGGVGKRTPESWAFLTKIIKCFDLMAVQEVMDDLSGLEHLTTLAGTDYKSAFSDTTGAKPGRRGNPERLGFIYNNKKVTQTQLASEITTDRTEIINILYQNRNAFNKLFDEYDDDMTAWEEKAKERKAQGKRAPTKPTIGVPCFIAFIRQPSIVSFQITGAANSEPYEFLAVNAHLLYGINKQEREWEFKALIEWLTIRAKYVDRLYHPNLLLLGDCNLDFDTSPAMASDIDAYIKGLNKTVLKSKKVASANFPMLSKHPQHGYLKTALRQKATYDQIGLFSNDPRLPKAQNNSDAGLTANGFNYGVFNIANLIGQALHGKDIDQLTNAQRKDIFKNAEFDISDHMPIWMRLKNPD